MKQHMQTVINVCLAIGFTALIYQNTQLKDTVDTLESYAQLDTDKTWDRLDTMDIDIKAIQDRLDKNLVFSLNLQEVVDLNTTNIETAFANNVNNVNLTNQNYENLKILDGNIDKLYKRLEDLTDYLLK